MSCSCRRKGGACLLSRPAQETMTAGSECARGLFIKRRALRSGPTGLRNRARHQPRSDSRGVAGCPRMKG